MRENDEITDLFRSRLAGAEMTVREDFWEKLQSDLSPTSPAKKRILFSPGFYRATAAASVVLVLGAASAAFWYFSPKAEIQEAFTQIAAMTPDGNLNGDVVHENFPSIHQTTPTAHKPGAKLPASGAPAALTAQAEDEESVSVHLSITITQRVYGNQTPGNGFYNNRNVAANDTYQAGTDHTKASPDVNSKTPSENEKAIQKATSAAKQRNWALKAALGTSLPKADLRMPLTAGISIERQLSQRFSLEAGLQYNNLSGEQILHTLGIPVKLNTLLASTSKVDLYATIGAMAEKCIAGAPNNSFDAEPIQLSVLAGVGVRYKMNDRFALFAEPSVSHHFDTDSNTKTLRTARSTNLNLLCGLRMTY